MNSGAFSCVIPTLLKLRGERLQCCRWSVVTLRQKEPGLGFFTAFLETPTPAGLGPGVLCSELLPILPPPPLLLVVWNWKFHLFLSVQRYGFSGKRSGLSRNCVGKRNVTIFVNVCTSETRNCVVSLSTPLILCPFYDSKIYLRNLEKQFYIVCVLYKVKNMLPPFPNYHNYFFLYLSRNIKNILYENM